MIPDLTNVTDKVTKRRFGNNLLLPITKGKHQCDFDLIEEYCDPTFIWEQKRRSLLIDRKLCGRKVVTRGSWVLPLGFYIRQLPKGAIIRI